MLLVMEDNAFVRAEVHILLTFPLLKQRLKKSSCSFWKFVAKIIRQQLELQLCQQGPLTEVPLDFIKHQLYDLTQSPESRALSFAFSFPQNRPDNDTATETPDKRTEPEPCQPLVMAEAMASGTSRSAASPTVYQQCRCATISCME